MYFYSDKSVYIESKKPYKFCSWLTVEECEKKDISPLDLEPKQKLFSMNYSDIINGRYSQYNYEITPFEDVKICNMEFSIVKIADVADVLKDYESDYSFYICKDYLIVKNCNGIGIIRGFKRIK